MDFRIPTKSHHHIMGSIVLFVASLFFPAFYVHTPDSPWQSYLLLLTGWLGVMDAHFSWFANPFYLLAIIFSALKRKVSMYFEAIALLLALSFLLHRTVMVDEGGHSGDVVRYGLGYYLWVLAMAVLFIEDLSACLSLRNESYRTRTRIFGVIVVGLVSLLFCSSHILEEHKQSAIARNRTKVFQEKCRFAGETIYNMPGKVTGVYFRWMSDDGHYPMYDKIVNGVYGSYGGGTIQNDMVNRGFLRFSEIDNKNRAESAKPYRRFIKGDLKGEEVNRLESEYTVQISPGLASDTPKELDIHGLEVKIIDNSSQEVLAKTTYFVIWKDRRFCGSAPAGKFSDQDFIVRVLNLEAARQGNSR